MQRIVAVILLSLIWPPTILAEPVAIVEDINAANDSIFPMDFLDVGTIIELAPEESILIGYLASCVQESIKGGTVTVGQQQSEVNSGHVSRSKLDCEGGKKMVEAGKNQEAGAVVFRAKKNSPATTTFRTIRSLFPIVRLSSDSEQLLVTRSDGKGRPRSVAVEKGVADFGKARVQLKRNKVYTFSLGEQSITIKVSPKARRDAPILSRVILF